MQTHVTRSLAAAAAAMGLVASGSFGAIGSSAAVGSPPAHSTARPALKLETARRTVTLESYQDEVYLDLGIYAVAGNRPFEIRAKRTSYQRPITAKRSLPGRDAQLPTGLVKDFSGLTNFFSLSIRDAGGHSVVSRRVGFCPSGYASVRRRANAPDTSPYPDGCAGNPYSTGAVWGIQQGWGTSALGELNAKLKPGTYTADVAITTAYRKALHITSGDSRATVNLKVVKGNEDEMAAERRLVMPGASRSRTGVIWTSRPPCGTPDDPRWWWTAFVAPTTRT